MVRFRHAAVMSVCVVGGLYAVPLLPVTASAAPPAARGSSAAPATAPIIFPQPVGKRPAQRVPPSRPAGASHFATGPSRRTPAHRSRWAPVELFSVNHRESLKLRLADDRGRPMRGLDKRMSHFLRCHHTNAEHRMDPRLIRLLYETGRHYPGRRLDIVSGYRHPSVARNPRSPHMAGLACDFRVDGVKNADLRDYLRRAYPNVGVGYYPNSSFVHLDVRKKGSAFWIDYSGPQEDAVYSDNPTADLRSGRVETWKPKRIDPNWAQGADAPDDDDGDGNKSTAPPATADPDASVRTGDRTLSTAGASAHANAP